MGVKEKDKKAIWGLSGALCNLCEVFCIETSEKSSLSVLVGEVAHIEGENKGSARFREAMSSEEKNSIPNLLLLCPNCHTKVDGNEKKYTVGFLKKLKNNHENKVRNSLKNTGNLPEQSKIIYDNVINHIDQSLQLNRWDEQTDCCLRMMLTEWFHDGLFDVYAYTVKWNPPGDLPLLDERVVSLGQHCYDYVSYFMKNASLFSSTYRERKPKSWLPYEQYSVYVENSEKWVYNCRKMLDNLSLSMRDFAHSVRKYHNKYFHPENKDFWLYDGMGVWISPGEPPMQPKWHIPQGYYDMEEEDLSLSNTWFLD